MAAGMWEGKLVCMHDGHQPGDCRVGAQGCRRAAGLVTGGAPDPAEAGRAGPSCTVPGRSNPHEEPRPEDINRRREESKPLCQLPGGRRTSWKRRGRAPVWRPRYLAVLSWREPEREYVQGRERRKKEASCYIGARAAPLWRRPASPCRCN